MAIQYNQQQTQIETLAAELAEYEQRLAALQGAYDEQEKTVKAKDDLLATMGMSCARR